jgi:glucose/arabinose dehydrogenase
MLRRLAAAVTVSLLCLAERSAAACTGDCDGGGGVSIDELIQGVNIALGNSAVFQCRAFDGNGNENVTIDELVAGVGHALEGCPAVTPTAPGDTPTVVSSETPFPTPTPIGPTKPFCDLPGSLQFTESGKVLVPGGPSAPDLSWLELPAGFCVHYYANVPDVRQLRFAPGGELFAASPSTLTTGGAYEEGLDAIVVLPDDNFDGAADAMLTFLDDLPSTQGLMFANGYFYYQDRTRIRRLPYAIGDRSPKAASEEVIDISRDTGHHESRLHWPKVLDIADDGTIYVTNGAEDSERCEPDRPFRGGIVSVDGVTPGGKRIARGFRNPIGIRCLRGFNRCYAIELSRDYTAGIGGREKLVPVREGDDWGHPCCATRQKPYPDRTPVPDCSEVDQEGGAFVVGNTPFDLDFETGKWPPPWNNRVYIPMHGVFGTWENERLVSIAYDPVSGEVIMGSELPAQDPGSFLDFATGWDDGVKGEGPHGRPANIAFAPDGRLFLGNDNTGDIIWIAPLGLQ